MDDKWLVALTTAGVNVVGTIFAFFTAWVTTRAATREKELVVEGKRVDQDSRLVKLETLQEVQQKQYDELKAQYDKLDITCAQQQVQIDNCDADRDKLKAEVASLKKLTEAK